MFSNPEDHYDHTSISPWVANENVEQGMKVYFCHWAQERKGFAVAPVVVVERDKKNNCYQEQDGSKDPHVVGSSP